MTQKEIKEEMRSTAMSIVNAFDLEFDDADLQNFYAMLVGSFLHYFKAGAKWMAQQGETQEHFVIGSIADSPCSPAIVHYTEKFAIGDEVIVQIRKKRK